MNLISVFLFLGLMFGCGKAPEMQDYQQPKSSKSAGSLLNKTPSEITTLKYNHQIFLNCVLRVSDDEEIHLMADPADTSMLRIMNYQLGKEPYVVVVKIAEPMEIMDRISFTTLDKREYFMEHSPVLKILYRRAPKSILTNGSVHDEDTFFPVTLFENVEVLLENRTTEVDDGKLVSEELRCTLKTTILPAYKDQWQIVK